MWDPKLYDQEVAAREAASASNTEHEGSKSTSLSSRVLKIGLDEWEKMDINERRRRFTVGMWFWWFFLVFSPLARLVLRLLTLAHFYPIVTVIWGLAGSTFFYWRSEADFAATGSPQILRRIALAAIIAHPIGFIITWLFL